MTNHITGPHWLDNTAHATSENRTVSVNLRAEAKQAEARLITEVGAGQLHATSNRAHSTAP